MRRLEKNKQGEAIDLIKHYEETIKTGNKKAIRYADKVSR